MLDTANLDPPVHHTSIEDFFDYLDDNNLEVVEWHWPPDGSPRPSWSGLEQRATTRKAMTTDKLIEIIENANEQADIAEAYALGIRQDYGNWAIVRHTHVDWAAVNRAILTRYTPSELNRIKEMAWGRINLARMGDGRN